MANKVKIAAPGLNHEFDDTANDSSKSWIVPNDEVWKINHGHVILTSTATVGNRLMQLDVQDDASNLIVTVNAGAVQVASNTYHYVYMQGIYRETSFVLNEMQVPVPVDLFLKPGWTITFHDANAIDAAADDMTVAFSYQVMKI